MPESFSPDGEGPRSNEAAQQALLAVRRNAEIFAIDGGWFQARWHFSFDQYHDPQNMGIGTLRVFNHDTLLPGAVWPMHPHRDIEGITYVVAGSFEHADSMGNNGILAPGGVQRMTLGSGASHSERNHSKTEPMQFIQMWIIPSRGGLVPSVEQRQFTDEDRYNDLLQIVRPEGMEGTGVLVHQDVSMYVSKLNRDTTVEHTFRAAHGGYFYLIEGDVELNGERLMTGDAAKIQGKGLLFIHALSLSELILVDTSL